MSEIKNVIEFRNAVKDYGDFRLDNISFAVPEGSVCGFIGQNGAGKTTTIAMLLDIISRDSGEVLLFGEQVDGKHSHLREDVGVVFDEMGFHEFLTAKQINAILKNSYKNWSEEAFFDNLRKFSLPSNKKCGAFSRGMRMKLQIAAALSHNAKLLVMDEPTSGLDPIVRNEIIQIFREFMTEEDHTILLSSHITGDLEKIAEILKGTNIIILSDEIYSELTYGNSHASIAQIGEMQERTVLISGFSKAYSMTGWRLGYILCPAPLCKQMTKIHQFCIMSSPTVSQYAAIEALKNGDDDIASMRAEYDVRRTYVVNEFRKMGLSVFEPKGAFYVFPCIKSSGMTSDEFCERLLKEKKVATVPGNAFGECGEGFIRVSYCNSLGNLKIALSKIKEFLKENKNG